MSTDRVCSSQTRCTTHKCSLFCQAQRQKRFGANLTLDNRKRPSGEMSAEDLTAKKRQAERLGLPIKGTKLAAEIASMGQGLLSPEEEERRKARAARFATSGNSAAASSASTAAPAATSEEEEKKRRRMERFAKK